MKTALEVRRVDREGHGTDTFLREGSQDQDMGTGSREERHPSYTGTQPRSLLGTSFPNPTTPSKFLAQMPALLVSSTFCGQKGNEDMGNCGTFCLWVACLGELFTQPILKSQPQSGSKEARVQKGE